MDYRYNDVTGLLSGVSAPYHPYGAATPAFTVHSYDYLGRETLAERPDGASMSHSYGGAEETVTGFDGQETKLTYNPAGLVTKASNYGSVHTTPVVVDFTRYGDGLIKTSVVDGDPATAVSYAYDVNRRPSSVTDPSLGILSCKYAFAPNGNVTTKDGVGSYSYGAGSGPYAVSSLQPASGASQLFPSQSVTYTAFDKISSLRQGDDSLSVAYGIDRQRVAQTLYHGAATRSKRYFTPLYETVTEGGITKKLHYLTSSTGLFAIFVTTSTGEKQMYYTFKDHQGSLAAVVHGNTVERLSYDAWGRRRNPVGFGYSNVTHTFDRGYTLHEHYDAFGLVNMNGRLYDPVLGRMLSPDILIQDEHNAQAYNRYSYCFNNPLRFTDPSGYVATMPFEYYGLETFSYGCMGKHSFKGSSFNTEAAEGMQRPDDDWFENEETGAVYYNVNMHKGDEGTGAMKGSGWNWLGENGMFSDGIINTDVSIVAKHHGFIGTGKNGSFSMELLLDEDEAKVLMASVGYKQVNTQEIVYSNTYDQSISDGRHSFRFTYGTSVTYSEKTGYIPNSYAEINRTQLGKTLYGKMNHVTGAFPEVSRYTISYGTPTLLRKVGNAIQIGRGIHDYVNYYDGGSVKFYYESGAQNILINDFLRKYPK